MLRLYDRILDIFRYLDILEWANYIYKMNLINQGAELSFRSSPPGGGASVLPALWLHVGGSCGSGEAPDPD